MIERAYAATAGGATVASVPLSYVNDWLQFVALVIAIASGALAIRSHYKREKQDEPV